MMTERPNSEAIHTAGGGSGSLSTFWPTTGAGAPGGFCGFAPPGGGLAATAGFAPGGTAPGAPGTGAGVGSCTSFVCVFQTSAPSAVSADAVFHDIASV